MAAMEQYNVLDHGQTQTRAVAAGGEEGYEYLFHDSRRDARAMIADANDQARRRPLDEYVDHAARGGMVQRVVEQVAQRQPEDNAANFRQLFAWHAEGKLKPLEDAPGSFVKFRLDASKTKK